MAQQPCITIVGTGLIGTSLGMAILSARGQEIEVLGHDTDNAQATKAQEMGGLSSVERNLISACARADMIILATPVTEIRETLQLIASDLKSGCVITDTAEVKVPVLEWADELLPQEVSFIGGDPILFGDEGGIESARADLFKDVLYCVTPSMRASSEGVKLVTDLVAMIGGIPYFIDPYEHDGLIGGTEHLADVLAATLLNTLSKSDQWPDMQPMGGGTFRRVTSFSEQDPAEYRGRAVLNQANLLRWIDVFQRELSEFRRFVEQEDGDAIEHYYGTHMDVRLQWLEDRANQDWGDRPQESEIPSSGEFMSQMFFGGFGRRRREG